MIASILRKFSRRSFIEYRDLGTSQATQGRFHAAVLRVHDSAKGNQFFRTTGMHRHMCDFQMFYVLIGWITLIYKGEGEFAFSEGDCCLQPAAVFHYGIQCSDDFECIEIYSSASHSTVAID